MKKRRVRQQAQVMKDKVHCAESTEDGSQPEEGGSSTEHELLGTGLKVGWQRIAGNFQGENFHENYSELKDFANKQSRIHVMDWIWIARTCDVREENFCECAQIHEI